MKTTKDLFKKIIKENNVKFEISKFQRPLEKTFRNSTLYVPNDEIYLK